MAVGVNLGVKKATRALGHEASDLIAVAYVQRKGTVAADVYLAGLGGLFGLVGAVLMRALRAGREAIASKSGLDPGRVPRGMLLALVPTAVVVFKQGKFVELDRFPVGTFSVTDLGNVGPFARRYLLRLDDGRDFILDSRKTGVSRANIAAMEIISKASA